MDRFELLGRFARSATGAFCLHLIGLGMVAGAVAALVTYLPDGDRELRTYEAAARCPTAPAGTEPADCLWTLELTVTEIDDPRGRSESKYAILRSDDGRRWKTDYGDPGSVWDELATGDHVTGTLWRGRITEVSARGESQLSGDAPADMRARSAVLAMVLLPSGLVLVIASAWRLIRRRASPTMTPGQRATFWLAFGFLMTALISPIPATWVPYEDEAHHALLTLGVWLPLAALQLTVAFVYTARMRARSEAAPS